MLATYTIRQIQTGWQFLDKAEYGTFREGYGTIIKHPVFCWLIEGQGRRDPRRYRDERHRTFGQVPP